MSALATIEPASGILNAKRLLQTLLVLLPPLLPPNAPPLLLMLLLACTRGDTCPRSPPSSRRAGT